MRCEASVVGLMVKRLACVVAVVVASEASGQGVMTVKSWGDNSYGQLDIPSTATNVTQVACGYAHTYALKNDGTLVGWGNNDFGQLDIPSTATNVTQVACGGYHTYALKNDGTLVGWGDNYSGQINTTSNATSVTQVACGGIHTVVLYEPDCNNDGVIDADQLAQGTLADLNNNWTPDTCEIARGWEEDCDLNGTFDSYQQQTNLTYAVQSAQLGPIGYTSPRSADLAAPPFTLTDPVLTVTAKGDFSLPSESITVYLNGRFVGQVFTDTGADKNDCRSSITRTITLGRAFYNEAINQTGGATGAVFEFVPTIAVSASQCPTGSWIQCRLEYMAAITGDCNANGLLDACETRDFPDTDANHNGIVDACEDYSLVFECAGDLDGSRAVDTGDMSLLLMSFGYAMPGDPNDLDANGHIDTADASLLLLSFGPCQ